MAGVFILLSMLPIESDSGPPGEESGVLPMPGGGAGNLIAERITIMNAGSSTEDAELRIDLEWSRAEFPGIRSCTIVAEGKDGREVGRATDTFAVLEPTSVRLDLPVSDAVHAARLLCDERLDTGRPYRYAFGEAVIEPVDGTADTYGVTFAARWEAPGHPGAVSCSISLLTADGGTLGSDSFNFYALEGTGQASTTFTVADPSRAPTDASIDCVPLGGSASDDDRPDHDYALAAERWGDNPPCPPGEVLGVSEWEILEERLRDAPRPGSPPIEPPPLDFVRVAPDDPTPFVDADTVVPDGLVLIVPCVETAPGVLVLIEESGYFGSPVPA